MYSFRFEIYVLRVTYYVLQVTYYTSYVLRITSYVLRFTITDIFAFSFIRNYQPKTKKSRKLFFRDFLTFNYQPTMAASFYSPSHISPSYSYGYKSALAFLTKLEHPDFPEGLIPGLSPNSVKLY